MLNHFVSRYRPGETRPAAARIKFVEGTEQGFSRNDIDIYPGLFIVVKRVVERRLGGGVLSYLKLQPRQLLFQLRRTRFLEVLHSIGRGR